MSINLISAIFRSPWYIDQDFVSSHAPLIAQFIQRGYVPVPGELQEEISKKPYAINPIIIGAGDPGKMVAQTITGSLKRGFDYDQAPRGSKVVIPIKGVLLKQDQDDGCGYFVAGMQTLARRIQEADQHPNIDGIILNIDSPGGTVDGTQALADAIKATQKPIVAFIDGMAASAAYFVASSADHIIAENESISAGSIGTMISIMDTQPYFEKLGVKFHDIFSTLSPDKNSDYMQALEGKYESIQKNWLDPFAKLFRDYVKANRPALGENTLTGKMFLAAESVKVNLIDEIGSIERAVEKIDELSGRSAQKTTPQSKPKQKTKMKNYSLLVALLAVDALEMTDDGVFLNEDQLQAIEQRLSAANQAETDFATANQSHTTEMEDLRQQHNTQLQGVQEQLTTAQSDLTAANNLVTERDNTIAQLTKGPAGTPAAATTAGDTHNASEDQLSDTVAELPTNDAIATLREAGFNY